MPSSPTIRRELRPGDLGAIVAHHGRVYLPEYGLDRPSRRTWRRASRPPASAASPARASGCGSSSSDGRHAGSLALTDEGDDQGAVRWFVLDRELRGHGPRPPADRASCSTEARAHGYDGLWLETFSELRAAAAIYRSHGFELVSEDDGPRWGRERITYQRYELSFQDPRPVLEPGEHRLERAALLGQRVGDAGRRARRGPSATTRPARLELAQPSREQAVGEPGHARGELGEVERAVAPAPRGSPPPSGGRSARSRRGNRGRTRSPGSAGRRGSLVARGCSLAASTRRSRLPNAPARPASSIPIRISIRLHMVRYPLGSSLPVSAFGDDRVRDPEPVLRPRRRSTPRTRSSATLPVQVDHRAARVAAAHVGAERSHLALDRAAAVGVLAGHRARRARGAPAVNVSGPFSGKPITAASVALARALDELQRRSRQARHRAAPRGRCAGRSGRRSRRARHRPRRSPWCRPGRRRRARW